MEKNIKFEQNTPLWDNSLSIEERLDYLTGAMTLEEKIHCLTTGCPDIPRLGIRATYMGGEAAHGIEARKPGLCIQEMVEAGSAAGRRPLIWSAIQDGEGRRSHTAKIHI